jgi:hypothetical protein
VHGIIVVSNYTAQYVSSLPEAIVRALVGLVPY